MDTLNKNRGVRYKMLSKLIENWKEYCIDDNFIGIGSTRKAYRVKDYVLKLNLHPLGYKQSKKELEIYNAMKERGFSELFAQIFYVDDFITIQKYYQPLEMENNQSYEIDIQTYENLIPQKYAEA